MTDVEGMDADPGLWAGAVAGVHGGVVLIRNREVYLVYTGDLDPPVTIDDAFFARRAQGWPTELTRRQLIELKDMILTALEES